MTMGVDMSKVGQWVNIKANAGTYATLGKIVDVLDGECPTYVVNATDCEGTPEIIPTRAQVEQRRALDAAGIRWD